jgi:hypothetical protein
LVALAENQFVLGITHTRSSSIWIF